MHDDQKSQPIIIYVDADACPVKPKIYRVAERYGIRVVLVANRYIHWPHDNDLVELVQVGSGLDAADDWIADHSRPGAVVVTADIPLASRAVGAGALVISPNGKAYNKSNIGVAYATRNLMDSLRSAGEISRGPAPFSARDRSAFLSALDLAIVRLGRDGFQR